MITRTEQVAFPAGAITPLVATYTAKHLLVRDAAQAPMTYVDVYGVNQAQAPFPASRDLNPFLLFPGEGMEWENRPGDTCPVVRAGQTLCFLKPLAAVTFNLIYECS